MAITFDFHCSSQVKHIQAQEKLYTITVVCSVTVRDYQLCVRLLTIITRILQCLIIRRNKRTCNLNTKIMEKEN